MIVSKIANIFFIVFPFLFLGSIAKASADIRIVNRRVVIRIHVENASFATVIRIAADMNDTLRWKPS